MTNFHEQINEDWPAEILLDCLQQSTLKGKMMKESPEGLLKDACLLFLEKIKGSPFEEWWESDQEIIRKFNTSDNLFVDPVFVWLESVNDIATDDDYRRCINILSQKE